MEKVRKTFYTSIGNVNEIHRISKEEKCTITKAFNEMLEFGIKFYTFAKEEGIILQNLEEVVKDAYSKNKQTRTNHFNNGGSGFI